MKENRDTYYIAALADGEIKDPQQEQKIRDEIDRSPDLQFELFVQKSVKDLVGRRLKIAPAPANVRKRLEKRINPVKKSLYRRFIDWVREQR